MDTGKAIFFGLALIALAIFARDLVSSATAASGEVGRYMIAKGPELYSLWRGDTMTGEIQKCFVTLEVCRVAIK